MQYNPSDSSFLSKFGTSLTIDSRLGGIFHVRGNHWLPIAIDITAEELLYGDPAGSMPESEVISVLHWFVAKHTSLPFDQLDEEALPCAKQHVQTDWFHCALYSYNSLHHYFVPGQPLIQHTENPAFGDLG